MGTQKKMKITVCLVVLAFAQASAYSSGSSYASGSSATPTPASGSGSPTPTPTVKTKTIHTIKSKITLNGVPASAFDKSTTAGQKVRLAFKNTIAAPLKICESHAGHDHRRGSSQCHHDDVTILSVKRRRRSGASVDFYVKTSSAATAKSGATTLGTFLAKTDATGFTAKLKAEATKQGATALGNVTSTTVVSAPVAGTSVVPTPSVSGTTTTALAMPFVSLACAALAMW